MPPLGVVLNWFLNEKILSVKSWSQVIQKTQRNGKGKPPRAHGCRDKNSLHSTQQWLHISEKMMVLLLRSGCYPQLERTQKPTFICHSDALG
ncbi:hypothetical protein ASF91_03805 [Rhizobium sp. Leaf155]|nr:hypothetical protein ASF91_03805 [Rhizobium sp. Leaf155]